jgi:chromosome partitioning protein
MARRAILNPKGGCGKTTLVAHLARALHLKRQTVLLADADAQGSARDWHNAGDGKADFPVIDLDRPTLDRDLASLGAPYQWVFIDGAAKLEKMIAAAVKAADLVLIPIEPSPLDIWACDPLVEMIQARQTVTDGAPAAAFVVTRAKKGTLLAREVADAIKTYGFPIQRGSIYDRTIFARSTADEPAGPGAWEIHHLLKHIQDAFDV